MNTVKTTSTPLNAQEKRLFAGAYSTFVVNGMLALILGAMMPYLRESYGLDYQMAGLLISAHSVGNLISSFVSGVLPLYLGRRGAAGLLAFCGVFGFFLIAVSSNPALLLLAFICTGLARGNASYVDNSVINDIATGKAWALNLLHGVFALGAFLAPFLVLSLTAGSPARWVWSAIIMLLCCAMQCIIFSTMKFPNNRPAQTEKKLRSFVFLRSKTFMTACGILFFYLCAEQGVNGWLVTYFKDSGIMSEGFAQAMASILWLFIFAGRMSCAALSTRIKKSVLLCIAAIGYIIFMTITLLARSLVPAAIGIVGLGFCMAGLYPTTVADVGDDIKKYPLALPTLLTIAGFGAILMPSIIGAVAQNVGIIGGMSTIIIAAVLTLLCIFYNAWLKREKAPC